MKYQCEKCDVYLASKQSLINHQKRKIDCTKLKSQQCEDCGDKFSSKKMLDKHICKQQSQPIQVQEVAEVQDIPEETPIKKIKEINNIPVPNPNGENPNEENTNEEDDDEDDVLKDIVMDPEIQNINYGTEEFPITPLDLIRGFKHIIDKAIQTDTILRKFSFNHKCIFDVNNIEYLNTYYPITELTEMILDFDLKEVVSKEQYNGEEIYAMDFDTNYFDKLSKSELHIDLKSEDYNIHERIASILNYYVKLKKREFETRIKNNFELFQDHNKDEFRKYFKLYDKNYPIMVEQLKHLNKLNFVFSRSGTIQIIIDIKDIIFKVDSTSVRLRNVCDFVGVDPKNPPNNADYEACKKAEAEKAAKEAKEQEPLDPAKEAAKAAAQSAAKAVAEAAFKAIHPNVKK